MYKSRLQELCQKLGWGLPEYTTSRTGPDHMARFTATVKVKGGDLFFETPNNFSTSSKEAQSNAAHVAFDHINNTIINHQPILSPPPTSLPTPSTDILHKNRLQQYGQKNNLGFPVYTYEAEGPPHNRKFKSKVYLDGRSYGTLEFFMTLKEAEQAAAKVACQMLSIDDVQEDSLYKNRLQELAQKMNLPCPSYKTASCGLSHMPVFMSSVEVGSDTFRGGEALTKKQAEMNAAKVAYLAISEQVQAYAKNSRSGDGIEQPVNVDGQTSPQVIMCLTQEGFQVVENPLITYTRRRKNA